MKPEYTGNHSQWYAVAQRYTIEDTVNDLDMELLCYARIGIKNPAQWKCQQLYEYLSKEIILRASAKAIDSFNSVAPKLKPA